MNRKNNRTTALLRVGVLGSGSGTNLQSLIDACEAGRINAAVSCVISDVKDAFILERARKHGIPAEYVDCGPSKTRLEGDAEKRCMAILLQNRTGLVALAGFMRMVKDGLLSSFPNRILNIHPALLPAFPGLESWKQALDYGARLAGCTVHIVDPGMDTGPIVVQKAVPVLEEDTPDSLHARIQVEEHKAYPEALELFAGGKIRIEGRRVFTEKANSKTLQ
ncbi:MAG: phosphoribosylglycinamide formyltransferase [Kiritimatiellia bacterium]